MKEKFKIDREKLEKIVKLLGYTMEDTTSKTIYQLIEENK